LNRYARLEDHSAVTDDSRHLIMMLASSRQPRSCRGHMQRRVSCRGQSGAQRRAATSGISAPTARFTNRKTALMPGGTKAANLRGEVFLRLLLGGLRGWLTLLRLTCVGSRKVALWLTSRRFLDWRFSNFHLRRAAACSWALLLVSISGRAVACRSLIV